MKTGIIGGVLSLFFAALPALAAEEEEGARVLTEEAVAKCTIQYSLNTMHLLAFVEIAAFIAALTLLSWGLIRLWNKLNEATVGFDLPVAVLGVIAALTVVFAEIVVPIFTKGSIYLALGDDLPAPTIILRDYYHLLLVPLVLAGFAMFQLTSHPLRVRYYSGMAALLYGLLCLALWAFYIPAVVSC